MVSVQPSPASIPVEALAFADATHRIPAKAAATIAGNRQAASPSDSEAIDRPCFPHDIACVAGLHDQVRFDIDATITLIAADRRETVDRRERVKR
ncbi:MAG: hypothetical protein M5R36_23785 [Deltaproteobacteria bacterium]|nr:hypothetical protein [Deltaproteobacteria bacterium]